jgi:uncharacterized membrane protein
MDLLWLKYAHILGAILIFGTGLGTAFHMWCAHRTGRPEVIAAVGRSTVLADWLFTAPSVVLQPVTGALLIRAHGWSPLEPWIAWSLGLYALVGACWLPVIWLQLEMQRLAAAVALQGGRELPTRYHRLARTWFVLGWPAFIAMFTILHLMVFKPGS